MDWKIRNIRLQELRDIYLEKLEKVTYQLYESHLRNDIIKQEELDEEIKSYYQHTQPSLQEFYYIMLRNGNIFTKVVNLRTPLFCIFLRIQPIRYK